MSNAVKGKQSFPMYNSFIEAAGNLDDAHFKECILKIRDYALYEKNNRSEHIGVNIILDMAKPVLDAAKKRYERCVENGKKGGEYGKKGGRPKKETHPQEKPQEKPLNEYAYVDAYANEKEDVYSKDYVYLKNENDYLKEKDNIVAEGENTTENKFLNSPTQRTSSNFIDSLQINDDLELDYPSSNNPSSISDDYWNYVYGCP